MKKKRKKMHVTIMISVIMSLIFSVLCISGCSSKSTPENTSDKTSEESSVTGLKQPDFPLEEEAVISALEQVGLPWVISESDTMSVAENNIIYALRDPEKTYLTGEEMVEGELQDVESGKVMYASVSSAITEGERFLSVHFLKDAISWRELPVALDEETPAGQEMPGFIWEDWKQQIELAAILYGGFESKEEFYQAFAEQEVPESKDLLQWEAEFPGAYCRIVRSSVQSPASSVPESYDVRVMVYESKELYEKMLKESQENYQKAQEERKKILEEKQKEK